jgi:hypothetical protein
MTESPAPSSYPPPVEFAANANANADLYKAAEADRLGFWAEQANRLSWATPFDDVLDWSGAPLPSGSSAASSTSPTTASTATSRPVTAIAPRSTGRASRSATAAS